ncbi:FecCD family ABC transporter permease [Cohnella sp.]|uniref:FecCD family ABC transporter permease n=1 Tax=Cohnella sp. TaxID=1883426 RepID=UPI0035652B52
MPAFTDSTNTSVHSRAPKLRSRPLAASFILFGGIFALIISIALSVSFGAAEIAFVTVWEAVFRFNPDLTTHQIIQELRLPRVLGGAMVGASFAVAGALMQGMTRNPMADSGLLGLNAGAGLVFGISSLAKGGLTPVRLVLAGAGVSALLAALSEGIALYFRIGQDLAFWYAGGVAGTKWFQLKVMFPWVGGAIIAAMMLSRSITVLSLGEEIAAGLGQRTRLIKLAGTVIVLILAGSAVAVVGTVGFVGLIIPHLTRFLVGVDYRWIIPCSAVLGSLLVVFADLGARMINPPFETPIGALIALIGVPFFLYLARKERREL